MASALLSFGGGRLWGRLWERLWEQLKGFSFGSLTWRRKDTYTSPCPRSPASPRHLSINREPGSVQFSCLPPLGWVHPVGQSTPPPSSKSFHLKPRGCCLEKSRTNGREGTLLQERHTSLGGFHGLSAGRVTWVMRTLGSQRGVGSEPLETQPPPTESGALGSGLGNTCLSPDVEICTFLGEL